MKTRTASCCCGDLSITVSGEPERVLACHCDYCQKRTGNVFQVSCWYGGDQVVSRTGEPQIFNEGPNNPGIDYCFCKRCGSTVYWHFRVFQQLMNVTVYGIAVGNFVDADFPKPQMALYCRYRHHWIEPLEGVESYPDMPPSERLTPKLT